MSTEYKIVESEHINLVALEHSGNFDLDVDLLAGTLTLSGGLSAEELAEVGLRLMQAALFNCADSDKFEAWLHERVRELGHGS